MKFGYSWEMSMLILVGIVVFFIIMILRKQLFDFLGFSLNIMYTLPISLGLYLVAGFIFGIGTGFIVGMIGIVIGGVVSYFVGSEYEGGDDEGGYDYG